MSLTKEVRERWDQNTAEQRQLQKVQAQVAETLANWVNAGEMSFADANKMFREQFNCGLRDAVAALECAGATLQEKQK